MTLGQTIPALPVTAVADAATFYESRLGFTTRFRNARFAIVVRDAAELHPWQSDDETWRSRTEADLHEHPVQSGAESFIAGTASCRIALDSGAAADALYDELAAADVLHPRDHGSAVDTDFGTREFAALDLEGNLLTFFHRATPRT
ncbi:MAG: VOC family protein [Nocardioides sp.]